MHVRLTDAACDDPDQHFVRRRMGDLDGVDEPAPFALRHDGGACLHGGVSFA
jgi:hypothetical protein